MMDHPKSGLPDFGRFRCASRINPTCVVKPAGDACGSGMLNQTHRTTAPGLPTSADACSQIRAGVWLIGYSVPRPRVAYCPPFHRGGGGMRKLLVATAALIALVSPAIAADMR